MIVDTEKLRQKIREELLRLEQLKSLLQEKLSTIDAVEKIANGQGIQQSAENGDTAGSTATH